MKEAEIKWTPFKDEPVVSEEEVDVSAFEPDKPKRSYIKGGDPNPPYRYKKKYPNREEGNSRGPPKGFYTNMKIRLHKDALIRIGLVTGIVVVINDLLLLAGYLLASFLSH